jgi:hypothetical protein
MMQFVGLFVHEICMLISFLPFFQSFALVKDSSTTPVKPQASVHKKKQMTAGRFASVDDLRMGQFTYILGKLQSIQRGNTYEHM